MLSALFSRLARKSPGSRPLAPGESIVFVTSVEQPCAISPEQRLESDQASVRLRVGIPARELARKAQVWLVPVEQFIRDPELKAFGKVGAIIVGKLPVRFFTGNSNMAAALLASIKQVSAERRVIVDFSDDLRAAAAMYSLPQLGEIQKRLLHMCAATVPTAALREQLSGDARHGIEVVEDPFEAPLPGTPRFRPGERLRIVWFGVFGPPLQPFIERAFIGVAETLGTRAAELAFVTYANQGDLVKQLADAVRAANTNFLVRPVAWSVAATAAELERADIVVLPQDATSEWGRAKSHNRLVESIWAGRFTVASPVPAYQELERYAWIGDDLASGVDWALAHPDEAESRIVAGQNHIGGRFSPAAIGARWACILKR